MIRLREEEQRREFVKKHYPEVLVTDPQQRRKHVGTYSRYGGADAVLEVAGSEETFRMAWECARPNAVVTVVALYDGPQIAPLPDILRQKSDL